MTRWSLPFDCDQTASAGTKEAVWLFAERCPDVRHGWFQVMQGEALKGRQPERLSREEWETAIQRVQEPYDVNVFSQTLRPMGLGFKTDALCRNETVYSAEQL